MRELKNICNLISEKIQINNKNNEIDSNIISINNYVSTENMIPNKCGIENAEKMPNIKNINKFSKNDVLISNIRPYFKKIWFATHDGGCSTDILVFRAKKNINPCFLYYVLSNNSFFDYATLTSRGTKMPRGDKSAIMKYIVPDISLKKQNKIAQFLSNIDKKIESNRKINKNLYNQIHLIYKKWFMDFKFLNDDKNSYIEYDGEMISSSLGLIPLGWEIESLGDGELSKIIGSGIDDFKGFKYYIATANVTNTEIDNDLPKITQNNKPSRANMQPISKSVWFAKMKDSRKLIMVDNYSNELIDNCIFSTGFAGLQCSENSFYYIWSFLLSNQFDVMKNNLSLGTTMQAINNTNIKKIEIISPESKVLEKYNLIIKPFFEKIHENNSENQKLTKIRDILLPKLMSGEIDVSDMEI
ncbi:MAG: restriction endonuclease subunit S [Methanobrevibacter sp.]|jgi:type I restriction enzyme S subunit|nr:restriction endonuclease subunit S [Candidatus Methanoflexus mossambicus]